MRKEANDFLKICDILDRDYQKTEGNKFRYTKNYLEQKVGYDYDQLKSIHAEAIDGKVSDIYGIFISLFALIISTITLMITMVSALWPKKENQVDKFLLLLCLLYIGIMIIASLWFAWSIGKNASVGHWQKYIVEAIEDILDEMKNREEGYKKINLPDKLYDKLDILQTKVGIPDQLYEQLDSIKKAAIESPLEKMFGKNK